MTTYTRQDFREHVFDRDNHTCIIPWCDSPADDAHHLLERELWAGGGYTPNNGASVCNHHHQYAESNDIPPQSFWMWSGIGSPPLPEQIDTHEVDKWGDTFNTPPWDDLRDEIKYISTRHMMPLYWHDDTHADERIENDDTQLTTLEPFVGIPLVITHKIDGGNTMLVNDVENPVRARNGTSPEDTMKPLYRDGGLYWTHEVSEKLPDRLQVFGEWVHAKHSIHYGCDCDEPCDDIGPGLSELTGRDDDSAYFQVFAVYDRTLNLWLSWPETKHVADTLDFPTVPVIHCESDQDTATFDTVHEARQTLTEHAHRVIDNGGEGIVVRSKFPFHFGQSPVRLGKYVRENHVEDGANHWSSREVVQNNLTVSPHR